MSHHWTLILGFVAVVTGCILGLWIRTRLPERVTRRLERAVDRVAFRG